MDYDEFPPTPRLAPYIDRLWTLTGTAAELEGACQPVLPDGRPELVIHFGDRFERVADNGSAERQENMLFAGQLMSQLLLRPTGRIAVLGIRFQPYGARAFMRVPQDPLAGTTPALEDVDSKLARALSDILSMTDSPASAVLPVQTRLESMLDPSRLDRRVQFAADMIRRSTGSVPVESLAETVGMSRRQLERRFLQDVGMPPKRLARIMRFQAALAALEAGNPGGGAGAAASLGYADQSHFIREFRALAGCSPGEHLLRDAVLTGFFVTDRGDSSQNA